MKSEASVAAPSGRAISQQLVLIGRSPLQSGLLYTFNSLMSPNVFLLTAFFGLQPLYTSDMKCVCLSHVFSALRKETLS